MTPAVKPRLYIAGPMSGLPGFNYDTFSAVEHAIRVHGEFMPLNPARNFAGRDDAATYGEYLREDLRLLAVADGICLLPGWEDSPGAALENLIAAYLGLERFTARQENASVRGDGVPDWVVEPYTDRDDLALCVHDGLPRPPRAGNPLARLLGRLRESARDL